MSALAVVIVALLSVGGCLLVGTAVLDVPPASRQERRSSVAAGLVCLVVALLVGTGVLA